MGRLWLALALVVAAAAPVLGEKLRVWTPEPAITSAHLDIGRQRTSSGLYDVERLQLGLRLDPHVAQVRITLRTASGEESSILTTPDHLDLVRPDLRAAVGPSTLYVSELDDNGIESPRATSVVVAHRRHEHVRDGVAPIALFLAAPFLVALFVAIAFFLDSRRSARARTAAVLAPLALPGAEYAARVVRLRSLLVLGVFAGATAYVVAIASENLLIAVFFGAPGFLVLVFVALMRLIDALRALRLLARSDATAGVRLDLIQVDAGHQRATLRTSRSLLERARAHGLPKATL